MSNSSRIPFPYTEESWNDHLNEMEHERELKKLELKPGSMIFLDPHSSTQYRVVSQRVSNLYTIVQDLMGQEIELYTKDIIQYNHFYFN